MRVAVIAFDKPDSLELRQQTRPDHLAYVAEHPPAVGGPLLAEDGSMSGSLIIYEADSVADVEAIVANDPYVRAGLFESVTIREFPAVIWPQ